MKHKFLLANISESIIDAFKIVIGNAYENRENISFETSIKASINSFQTNPVYNKLSTYQANTILNTMSDIIRRYKVEG
jgi:hypothetical protein